ncbi:MAG: sulfite exporter TauE/SafE family protein [Lachnospiraceae bacterium]|nr:sulfite exporter TauE/SafE family protein [Lachnospiraceae bacterium]
MFWLAWTLIAFAGGVTQTLTGFGAALVMMLVLPYFRTVVQSAAAASATAAVLSVFLIWQYKQYLKPRRVLPSLVLYLAASLTLLQYVQKIDLKLMGILFGAFLTLLGLYYLLFAAKARIQDTPAATAGCSLFSGICSACFGVGGPLMSLLFLEKFPKREEYTANLQLFFLLTNLINTGARVVNGIFTADLMPVVLVGAAAIWGGKMVGVKLADRLSPDTLRKCIYLLVMLSGVSTLLKNL